MPINVHLEQLKEQDLQLAGELPADTLDLQLDNKEGLIHSADALKYKLEATYADDNLIVQGQMEITLACDCARCLKPFKHKMDFPEWNCVLPLKGPDAIEGIGEHVDLTPWVREDILLGLPQHPLCGSACQGLVLQREEPPETDADESSTVWSKLDEWKQ